MNSTAIALFAAVIAGLAVTLVPTSSARAASNFAWCAYLSTQGGSQSCSFATLEQCRAYVSGMGFCQASGRTDALAEMPGRRPRR